MWFPRTAVGGLFRKRIVVQEVAHHAAHKTQVGLQPAAYGVDQANNTQGATEEMMRVRESNIGPAEEIRIVGLYCAFFLVGVIWGLAGHLGLWAIPVSLGVSIAVLKIFDFLSDRVAGRDNERVDEA